MRERTRLEVEHARLEFLTPLREFEVIDNDTRKTVKDSFSIPFRFICHLEIAYKKTRQKKGATGTLIDRRFVLTSAHNLLTTDNEVAREILVSPARNGEPNSIGAMRAANWIVHPYWRRSNFMFDYALIKLGKEVATDTFIETDWKPLGCWGDPKNGGGTSRTLLSANDLDGRTVFLAGYPGGTDHQNFTMSGGSGFITGLAAGRSVHPTDVVLHHTVDTSKGESGSPLWVRDNRTDVRTLVGIHIGPGREEKGKFVTNRAVRITANVNDQIKSWISTL